MTLSVIFALLLTPLLDGIVRNLRGKIQSRVGYPIFQTYYDLSKLSKRARTAPYTASWVFFFTPFLLFALSVILVLIANLTVFNDIILFIYALAFFRFILGIESLESASPFAAVGASRESNVALYAEPIMIISVLVLCAVNSTTDIMQIRANLLENGINSASYILAAVAFIWAIYLELGRKPFDLAEAEQEIHEGVAAEFSGRDLAFLDFALLLKQYAMMSLFVVLFIPFSFGNAVMDSVFVFVCVGIFYILAIMMDNFGPRFKVLTSGRFNAFLVLGIALLALSFYVVGV